MIGHRNQVPNDVFIDALRQRQQEVDKMGSAFAASFFELQGVVSTINPDNVHEVSQQASEMLVDTQRLAEPLKGEPIQGERHARYVIHGKEQPEGSHWDPFANLPFQGVLGGVEAVKDPSKTDAPGHILTVVVDPFSRSTNPAIRGDRYRGTPLRHTDRHPTLDRLWVPSGGILSLRVDTSYILSAIMKASHSDGNMTQVREQFPKLATAPAKV